jgi:hypothetical protein
MRSGSFVGACCAVNGRLPLEVPAGKSGHGLAQGAERDGADGPDLRDGGQERGGDPLHEWLRRPRFRRRHAEPETRDRDLPPRGPGEARVQDLHAGGAVDDRVMGLRVYREPATRHPVDHPAAKERTVAIERRLVQLGHEVQQVVIAGSLGEGQVLDVVVRVPARGLAEVGRPAGQELRDVVEGRGRLRGPVRLHDFPHQRPAASGFLEQQQRADVCRAARRLDQ